MATRLPPGPSGLEALVSQLSMLRNPLQCFTDLAHQYGGVVSFRIGAQRAILLSDHALIARLIRDRQFIRSDETRRGLSSLLGQGLLSLEGATHLRHRRLMQPAFHRERIERYVGIMADETYRSLGVWQTMDARDLHEEMMRLTFAIVARCLFNTDTQHTAARVDAILKDVQPAVNLSTMLTRLIPVPLPPLLSPRAKRGIAELHALVKQLIQERRAEQTDRGDLLSMLLAARDEDGSALSDDEICAEALTILLAGHDTTAHALSWAWYLLTQHPELQQAAADEARAVAGDRPLSFADLPRLQIIDTILRETLRLYPPAWWADRVSDQDCELGGYHIPARTLVVFSAYVFQRDPQVFSRPNDFVPERFQADASARIPDGAYLPFGAGVHVCIGNTFALTEAKLILGAMAQHYSFRALAPQAVRPRALITLGMAEPFPVIATRRAAPAASELNRSERA